MRGMILAAGRGERMGALTLATPKPLLRVNEKYLIEYSIAALKRAGITEIVINVCYLAEQIKQALGNGQRFGVDIVFSEETECLGTGGGIVNALPLLGVDPFVVLSADIISDYSLAHLPKKMSSLAHLILTNNFDFHLQGDFGLQDNYISFDAKPFYTYASIGVFCPALFAECKPGKAPLSDALFPAVRANCVTGEYFAGTVCNVGTPAELAYANEKFTIASNR